MTRIRPHSKAKRYWIGITGSLIALSLGIYLLQPQAAIGDEPEPLREGECEPVPGLPEDNNPGPGSLRNIRPLDPPNLNDFIKNRNVAIALGKALFWDMSVGSDGVQACASCHFRAGADPRSKNQLFPGGQNTPDTVIQLGGTNYQLKRNDYPLTKFVDVADRHSTMLRTTNDVVSSQGVELFQFTGVTPGEVKDNGTLVNDPVFTHNGRNVRRSEPRNTPTVINAAFNRRNFWDGRADHIFNGVNPFGVRDPNAKVLRANNPNNPQAVQVRIDNGSLASQAVGPPLSNLEMGFLDRPFPLVARRLLPLRPLKQQDVHYQDSVLGPYARSDAQEMRRGLLGDYATLIRDAFKNKWWEANKIVQVNANGTLSFLPIPQGPLGPNQYTMMEYNFSLYFGLAIQLYEATLISDDAPIDRFFEGDTHALTEEQLHGMDLFEENGCAGCHAGAEFTNASTRILLGANGEPGEIVERMSTGNCMVGLYDQSFYNIGVRPWEEDLGIGNNDPFGNPLSIAKLFTLLPSQIPSQELLTIPYPNILNPPPAIGERAVIEGAFKVPSLRNIEFTAPYFHNGGQRTLKQVVQFYNRGGDFRDRNEAFIDLEIGFLNLSEADIDALVSFLKALGDRRVIQQKAPFDHPQILVPNGHRNTGNDPDGTARDIVVDVPAVGRHGGPAPPGFLRMSDDDDENDESIQLPSVE